MTDSAKQFQSDFFKAKGNHPHGAEALAHFQSTFVRPPHFNKLIEDLKPNDNYKKVVVIDGHPRSGKTWCVVKALEKIVGELDLRPDQWWTSGLDSLKVLPDDNSDLFSAACQVQDQIKGKSSLRYVFLDDFLGTNQLRPLGESILDQSVRPFFLWNEENPWLQLMADGSVLVITARSLHLALADILLDVHVRDGAPASTGIHVKNSRHGLFRTIDKGEPFGAFDRRTLSDVCRRNKENHPLMRYGDFDWVLVSAPLLAFDLCEAQNEGDAGTGENQSKECLTSKQKKIVSKALFGEDVDSLAETIKVVEDTQPHKSLDLKWRDQILEELYRTYLVVVAPGLLFLGYSAYQSLGIEERMGEIAVDRLYLTRTEEEFHSGRLPNEFYMIAIDEHFKHHLDLAAHVFARVVGHANGGSRKYQILTKGFSALKVYADPQQETLGLGLRGLIERALHNKDGRALTRLFDIPDFKELADAYFRNNEDCLLHLELKLSDLDEYCTTESCSVEITPGLAAAIGWVLFKFFGPTDHRVRRVVTDWFPARFKSMGDTLTADFSTPSHLHPKSQSAWHKVATYSTFLQWVIKMEIDPEEGGLLTEIIKLPSDCPDELRGKLEIVLFDELLWAANEENLDLGRIKVIEKHTEFLYSEDVNYEDSGDENRQLIVNSLFALAWHNRWMENPRSEFARKARKWINRFKARSFKWLKARPELIDDNLQYHWGHFITQRAVWMRDWCFENNPNEFELNYSRIAKGSENPEDNQLLADIANTVLEQDEVLNSTRIRNLLLLLGTRAERLEHLGVLLERIDALTVESRTHRDGVRIAVLQAIFELARQGFLDTWSESVTEEFRIWCKKRKDTLGRHIEEAWRLYWEELKYHTHLDLLPRREHGWKDVFPKDWEKLKRSGD